MLNPVCVGHDAYVHLFQVDFIFAHLFPSVLRAILPAHKVSIKAAATPREGAQGCRTPPRREAEGQIKFASHSASTLPIEPSAGRFVFAFARAPEWMASGLACCHQT
jgi:hypothetical protein